MPNLEPARQKPRNPPALGVMRILANLMSKTEGRGELAARAARELGDVVRLPGLGKNIFLLSHPRDLKRVMIQNAANYRKSFDYEFLARVLGQGLITSEGEIWQKDRRLQQPLFHGKALEQFFGTVVRCTEALVDRWKPGMEVSLEAEMARYTLHVIGERILSVDVRESSDEICHHFDVCQKQITARGLALVDIAKWIETPGERRFKKSLAGLNAIVEMLMEKRSKLKDDPYDLYSILRDSEEGRKRIRDQFVTLFLAGHETSAVALTWIFYRLAIHPEIDAEVAQESIGVIRGQPVGFETLDRLELTTRVINEGLRLYPPVSFMGREALADDELGGYPIPKGSIVVICPFATHRRPDLWERPEEFDPSRFTEANREKELPCQFIPFIAGPRGCIGQHLAMWELQLAVGMVTEKFRLRQLKPELIRPIPLVSLRPHRPVIMKVESRT